MAEQNDTYNYVLRLADNCLILGQRLAEWCGHGPVLEQDIALTNISLDLIGQARNYYQYASELTGGAKSEDDVAFLRNDREYQNLLLVEQPNKDFAYTIIRQYLFDVFHFHLLNELASSKDEKIASIAQKSIKEVTYHKRWSGQWVLRLGDGTEESNQKMQDALDHFWSYAFESIVKDDLDKQMASEGIGADLDKIAPIVRKEIESHLREATLKIPESTWNQTGGKTGMHSEHLGYLLAEMQHLQRAYPGAEW
ncbi:MAG: 1,2-phenylacetyl-CoA epoxidase subunit PaaC [Reichenbachiella sp.]|uniref:1,2-phenylacetyl-CoA epoxidase subunit PaaC n=1 Tax=Reichenbachiella sp. TaxID=2184521 RepID=UPI003296ECEB